MCEGGEVCIHGFVWVSMRLSVCVCMCAQVGLCVYEKHDMNMCLWECCRVKGSERKIVYVYISV